MGQQSFEGFLLGIRLFDAGCWGGHTRAIIKAFSRTKGLGRLHIHQFSKGRRVGDWLLQCSARSVQTTRHSFVISEMDLDATPVQRSVDIDSHGELATLPTSVCYNFMARFLDSAIIIYACEISQKIAQGIKERKCDQHIDASYFVRIQFSAVCNQFAADVHRDGTHQQHDKRIDLWTL